MKLNTNPKLLTIDGLDATGKTTLAQSIAKQNSNVRIFKTPSPKIEKLREIFDTTKNMKLRYLYYVLGNMITDAEIKHYLKENNSSLALLDRSFITTLSAHEARGLSNSWLNLGATIARQGMTPTKSIIIQVPETERLNRLYARNKNTQADFDNLKWAKKMESSYFDWANKLDWPTEIFINYHKSLKESEKAFNDFIFKKQK